MVRLLAFLMCAFMLAACSKQPDSSMTQADVERALAQTFGEDAFKIVDFARRGSAVDSTAPEGETRRVVYYDVELEVLRDLNLGDWDAPGAAALVDLLGAAPRSVQGVKAAGNVSGDRIVAHASSIYRKTDNRWSFVMPAGYRDASGGRIGGDTGALDAQQALSRLAEIMRSVESGGSSTAQRVVDQELQRSLARISGRLARIEQGYPLAAGPDRGEYAAFASALAAYAQPDRMHVLPLLTGGSEENIELLRGGSVILALAQADAAYAAYKGVGPFETRGAFPGLRALGSLYPEYVHFVVRSDASYENAGTLKGARIAMGPPGSAVRTTLTRVLAAHGFQAGKDYQVVNLRFNDAVPALLRGEIDVVGHVIGLPAAPLREVIGEGPGRLRLLPLTPSAINNLAGAADGMLSATIPARVYAGQSVDVATVSVPALLLTTEELTREEAARLLRLIYQDADDLVALGSLQGSQVSAKNALRGVTIPLHPAAYTVLRKLQESSMPVSAQESVMDAEKSVDPSTRRASE